MTGKKSGSYAPHGGLREPVNRILDAERSKELKDRANELSIFQISISDLPTLKRIGDGALSPILGPMTKKVFQQVLDEEKIVNENGEYAWAIPLSFPITDDEYKELKGKDEAVIKDTSGRPIGYMEIRDIFDFDKESYLRSVYGTERIDHPGARIVLEDDRTKLIGGPIWVFPEAYDGMDGRYLLFPTESRKLFLDKGWERIIAFQTRNPLHRAHEYAMVVAIERLTAEGYFCGVVLNPLLGELKSDDVPADMRMKTYLSLHDNRVLGRGDKDEDLWKKVGYDLNDQFELLGLEIKMFYAGPKEAVMHAIYRQNYGFSDIIIGRKHADAPFDDGTPIWSDFDAQEKFENLNGELLINNLNIGFAAYFDELGRVSLVDDHIDKGWKPQMISGTVLRKMLQKGKEPDEKYMRPEVADILIEYYKK
jgi:sulfate adenylyltransferase